MPTELENKNNGASGDDAAAKAVADKAAADAAAAAAGSGNGNGDGEETVTIKKSDLRKIEDDRDNYKRMGLDKKADEKKLKDGQGDDGENKNSAVIDEKKISEIVATATTKTLREVSEKTAKRTFLKDHPEYADDAQWTALMSNFTFRGGEVTHEDVLGRLESAVFEHKRSTGKLDEFLKSEHERGLREGRIQGEIGSGHGSGGAGDRNEATRDGALSQKGIEMSIGMHNDPEKVKKVDP